MMLSEARKPSQIKGLRVLRLSQRCHKEGENMLFIASLTASMSSFCV